MHSTAAAAVHVAASRCIVEMCAVEACLVGERHGN
jgi:hypothetical protein